MRRFICLVSLLFLGIFWGFDASADTATSQMGIYFTSKKPAVTGNETNNSNLTNNGVGRLPALSEQPASNWTLPAGFVLVSSVAMILFLKKKEKEGV